ncbi:MAG: amino acid ABC transporter substrate-binding protein [Rhodoglobus sp.]
MVNKVLVIAATAVTLVALVGCSASGVAETAAEPSAGTSLADVQKAGKLVVATEGTYRPFSFHEGGSGEITGYDIDVITAVADKLDVDVEFKETQFDGIFAGLEAGRFDVIANQISINPEREAVYDFSEPYTVSPGVLIVAEDNTDITSFATLSGHSSAQSLTSNWYKVAEDAGAVVQSVEGWAQAAELVRQGRVDATVNDKLTFLDYQKTQGDTGLKIVADTDDVSKNALVFRKGSSDLVAAVDKALDELRADGTLASISKKYFGEDVSK